MASIAKAVGYATLYSLVTIDFLVTNEFGTIVYLGSCPSHDSLFECH